MSERAQPIWKSFYYTTAGTLLLLPVFAHWCFSELRAKLADWDETLSAKLASQRLLWRIVSRFGDGWVYVTVYLWHPDKRIATSCFLAWGMGSVLKPLFRRRRQTPIRRRVGILNILG